MTYNKEKKPLRYQSLVMSHGFSGGFTLVEVLIVTGIVAILATFTALSLVGFRRGQDLEFDVQRIVAVLRAAQQSSILQEDDKMWGVCFWNPAQGDSYVELFQISSWIGTCSGSGYAVTARYALKSFLTTTNELAVPFERITGIPSLETSIGLTKSRGGSAEKWIWVYPNGKIEAQ